MVTLSYEKELDNAMIKMSARLYRGRSSHPIFQSWEGVLSTVEISFPSISWWKRLLLPSASMTEKFVDMTWEISSLEKGQKILAEVRPEGGFLNFSKLEKYRSWLDQQISIKDSIGKKTLFPSEKLTWPDNAFFKQYLFEIDNRDQLINLFDWFRYFEMMNIFIFNVDANMEVCAQQLQEGLKGQPFDLNGIVEPLNVFVCCDWDGNNLIIESPHERLIERFLNAHHVEPVLVSDHPLKMRKKTDHSLWFGNRRMFPPKN